MSRIITKAPLRGTSQTVVSTGAKLVHPQSQLIREPRLLVPGMQPLGPVRVDWSNPLAKSVLLCWVSNINNPTRLVIAQNSSAWTKAQYAEFKVDNLGCYLYPNDGIYNNGWFTISNYENCTAFVVFKSSGVLSGDNAIFSARAENNTNTRFYISNMSSSYSIGVAVGDTSYATYGSVVQNAISSAAVVRQGSVGRGYVNGAQIGSDFNVSFSGSGSNYLALGGYAVTPTTSNPMNINIYAAVLFNKVLTAAEIKSFHLDPYQFLIPA